MSRRSYGTARVGYNCERHVHKRWSEPCVSSLHRLSAGLGMGAGTDGYWSDASQICWSTYVKAPGSGLSLLPTVIGGLVIGGGAV